MGRKFLLMNCNGKAMVEEYDPGSARLYSYGTHVATVVLPEVYRVDGQPQSRTTAKHMREFFMFYGLPRMTKAELFELPITNKEE